MWTFHAIQSLIHNTSAFAIRCMIMLTQSGTMMPKKLSGSPMNTDHIQSLLSELSEQEQQQFEDILEQLKSVNGDMSQLSAEHQQMLTALAADHRVSEGETSAAESDLTAVTTTAEASDEDDTVTTSTVAEVPDRSPTDTPFGQYVVERIKTLCEGGSSMSDAVRYAFHNKYLPPSLREEVICKDILQRYQTDILTLADSFKSLESAHLADAKLLVGFAWFAVVYDCYQYVEAYGDLN